MYHPSPYVPVYSTRSYAPRPIVFFHEVARGTTLQGRYRQDLAECREYAQEVRKGEMVARGAGSGAAVGGAIGAIVGDSTDSAVRGAGVGAVSGGARGMSAGEREEMQVIKRCLRGRGYRVLN